MLTVVDWSSGGDSTGSRESALLFSHGVWLFAAPWAAACQASLSFPNSRSLLKLMSIESMMPPSYLNSVTHFSSCPQSFPSIRVFSNELALRIRWPKYWSFGFSISLFSEYSGLISFRIVCPGNSQESSPAPQFKSINYSVLSLLYDPTLASIRDYWHNISCDSMDLCQQSDVSAFWYAV